MERLSKLDILRKYGTVHIQNNLAALDTHGGKQIIPLNMYKDYMPGAVVNSHDFIDALYENIWCTLYAEVLIIEHGGIT